METSEISLLLHFEHSGTLRSDLWLNLAITLNNILQIVFYRAFLGYGLKS